MMYKDWFFLLDLFKFLVYGKNVLINWGLLCDCLVDLVYDVGKLKYSMFFEWYEVLNLGMDKEKIRVWFGDGLYDDCDLFIGVDGSYFKVSFYLDIFSFKKVMVNRRFFFLKVNK